MKIGIFGVGSPFGDDVLGWQIVDQLKNDARLQSYIPSLIHIHQCDRPGSRLLQEIEPYQKIYLIDAVLSETPIGTITRLENAEIEKCNTIISTHGLGIPHTLALGRALGNLPGEIIFYGITIDPTSSPTSTALLHNAIDLIIERLVNEVIQSVDLL